MRLSFIDPGALRSEFSLEQCVTTPDAFGGHSESWVEVATLFAHIEPLAARSAVGAGQTLETASHRVTVRWRPGLASGMRLRRNLRVLEIVTVHDPDETGRYLVCAAKEAGA